MVEGGARWIFMVVMAALWNAMVVAAAAYSLSINGRFLATVVFLYEWRVLADGRGVLQLLLRNTDGHKLVENRSDSAARSSPGAVSLFICEEGKC